MPEATLRGRLAIVTGASRDRGIAAAVCRELAARGANVLFTHWRAYDRTMEWGAEEHFPRRLQAELAEHGVKAAGLEIDLSDPAAPERILEAAAQLGSPVILVNVAAFSTSDNYTNLTAASLEHSMELGIALSGRAAAKLAEVMEAVLSCAIAWPYAD